MIEYLAMFLSITGNLFICFKKRQGFLLWIVANILWISFALTNKHWGMMILFTVYTAMSLFGWWNWGKEEKWKRKTK